MAEMNRIGLTPEELRKIVYGAACDAYSAASGACGLLAQWLKINSCGPVLDSAYDLEADPLGADACSGLEMLARQVSNEIGEIGSALLKDDGTVGLSVNLQRAWTLVDGLGLLLRSAAVAEGVHALDVASGVVVAIVFEQVRELIERAPEYALQRLPLAA